MSSTGRATLVVVPLALLASAVLALLGQGAAWVLFAIGLAGVGWIAWSLRFVFGLFADDKAGTSSMPGRGSATPSADLGDDRALHTVWMEGPRRRTEIAIHERGLRLTEFTPGLPAGEGLSFAWEDVPSFRPCTSPYGSDAILLVAGRPPGPWVLSGPEIASTTRDLVAAGVKCLDYLDLRPEGEALVERGDEARARDWANTMLAEMALTACSGIAAALFIATLFARPAFAGAGLLDGAGAILAVALTLVFGIFTRYSLGFWRTARRIARASALEPPDAREGATKGPGRRDAAGRPRSRRLVKAAVLAPLAAVLAVSLVLTTMAGARSLESGHVADGISKISGVLLGVGIPAAFLLDNWIRRLRGEEPAAGSGSMSRLLFGAAFAEIQVITGQQAQRPGEVDLEREAMLVTESSKGADTSSRKWLLLRTEHGEVPYILPAIGARPFPLLLLLHPPRWSPTRFAGQAGLAREAPDRGFLLLAPQVSHPSPDSGDDDVRAMAEEASHLSATAVRLVEDGVVDPGRVFVAGWTRGGAIAAHLAAGTPGLVHALACVDSSHYEDLVPSRPVAAVVFGRGPEVAPKPRKPLEVLEWRTEDQESPRIVMGWRDAKPLDKWCGALASANGVAGTQAAAEDGPLRWGAPGDPGEVELWESLGPPSGVLVPDPSVVSRVLDFFERHGGPGAPL